LYAIIENPTVLSFVCLFLFTDMKKIIELDPSNAQAKKSLFRLEPLAAEKKEKMKEEMLGKILHKCLDFKNSIICIYDSTVVHLLDILYVKWSPKSQRH
jgi:hypothetical protein